MKKRIELGGIFLLALLIVTGWYQQKAFGAISLEKFNPGPYGSTFQTYEFFASTTAPTTVATTTNATSTNIASYFTTSSNFKQGQKDYGYFVVAGAKNVEVYFGRGDTTGQGNTGTSTFRIQTSPDGTDWFNFVRLRQATSTTEQDEVQINSLPGAGTATSTVRFGMNLDYIAPYAIRCVVVEGVNGEHRCYAAATW